MLWIRSENNYMQSRVLVFQMNDVSEINQVCISYKTVLGPAIAQTQSISEMSFNYEYT